MITKAITYEDFDGNKVTDRYWFHLNKAELAEWEFVGHDGKGGSFLAHLKAIAECENRSELFKLIRDMVIKSVGIKSEDGKRIIKNDDIRDGFTQSDAYSTLLMELTSDADKLKAFVIGILPTDLAKKAEEEASKINLSR